MNTDQYVLMHNLEKEHWWFRAKKAFVHEMLKDLKTPLQIVDVGAGTGGMTQFLQQYGSVVGVEPNSSARGLARKDGITLVDGEANKLPFKTSSMNLVCLFDVLYHKNIHVQNSLKEALRILKHNGILIVTDCAFEFLRSEHDIAVQAARRWTKKKLCLELRQAGFIVEKASYTYFFLFPCVAVMRILKRMMFQKKSQIQAKSDVSMLHPLLNTLLYTICLLESKCLSFLSFPWGSSIIIRARKLT